MNLIKTGIKGLDNILKGGLQPNRSYLVRGGPGSGKTTLGLQFLASGENENNLFISLGESVDKIKLDAEKRNFNTRKINFLELTPSSDYFRNDEEYNIFSSQEVEKSPLIKKIVAEIDSLKPDRIFLDSVTYLSYLNDDKFQFRKEMLSLIKFAAEEKATFLIASESTIDNPDYDVQFVVDGVLNLSRENDERYFNISKLRGSSYLSGKHSLKLKDDGIHIYPNMIPCAEKKDVKNKKLVSGVPSLDKLLNGGIEKGTITIISGPTGVGKTTLGVQYMKEAAGRGEKSVIYTFEESPDTIIKRCEGINIPITDMIENSFLEIEAINPLKYSPAEFLNKVKRQVEERKIDVVLIDSLSGYKMAFPENSSDNEKIRQLHILNKYLSKIGVTVIIVNEVTNIIGDFKATGFGISYLADNIIILNYYEYCSQLKKTIGVLKKRLSNFERYLREFKIGKYGIEVGDPLTELQGMLTGNIVNIDNVK
ncbi:ATPase domain-containing protein [Halanaerobium sp. ST460_2HS_T2]|uniref:ATPase domain-containing protein n=1 Tax=Halanaerobium sp. ST460_2HS_T2 TaxID=2183914 RepID=UPI000DFB6576|nr:ATPase domain-containing protein [Halanaerobium sp. ST460_2HS_T2]RCW56568.1 circadian clock protein KaiC [Halanaerobium sp. ST460_2HS_T2]